MLRILALVLFCSLAAAPIGISSPTDATWGGEPELKPAEVWRGVKTFRGGERACVLVIGSVKTAVVNLEVSVFDHKNDVLVAWDQTSDAAAGDFASVIWYPPRDGEYRIEVRNPGASLKSCYIAIK